MPACDSYDDLEQRDALDKWNDTLHLPLPNSILGTSFLFLKIQDFVPPPKKRENSDYEYYKKLPRSFKSSTHLYKPYWTYIFGDEYTRFSYSWNCLPIHDFITRMGMGIKPSRFWGFLLFFSQFCADQNDRRSSSMYAVLCQKSLFQRRHVNHSGLFWWLDSFTQSITLIFIFLFFFLLHFPPRISSEVPVFERGRGLHFFHDKCCQPT